MKVKKSRKIKSLTDHEKLINLIAVQGEKDISKLLSSIDRVFIELFNLKESELPWLNTNTDKEWDDFMRKSRLAFYRIYFELIQKGLMANIGVMIGVGAPTSLAIDLAKRFNMTLVGFVKKNSFNIYTNKNRINL